MSPAPPEPVDDMARIAIQKTSVTTSATRTAAQSRDSSVVQPRSSLASGAPQAAFSRTSAGGGALPGPAAAAGGSLRRLLGRSLSSPDSGSSAAAAAADLGSPAPLVEPVPPLGLSSSLIPPEGTHY